jgi:hypothetical protein
MCGGVKGVGGFHSVFLSRWRSVTAEMFVLLAIYLVFVVPNGVHRLSSVDDDFFGVFHSRGGVHRTSNVAC